MTHAQRATQLADVLDGLESPTLVEVFDAVREFNAADVAAVAAYMAKTGGGESPGGSQPRVGQWTEPVTINALRWQTVDLVNGGTTPDGGTVKLTYNGEETVAIAWDATAAAVVSALAALPSLAGKVALGTIDNGDTNGPFPAAVVLEITDDPPLLITISDDALVDGGEAADVYITQEDLWHMRVEIADLNVGDVIEDGRMTLPVSFDGPGAKAYFTDQPGRDDSIPPGWQAPRYELFHLDGTADGTFSNFTGNFDGNGLLESAALQEAAQGSSSANAILPTECLTAATVYFSIDVLDRGVKAGTVTASLKIARAA